MSEHAIGETAAAVRSPEQQAAVDEWIAARLVEIQRAVDDWADGEDGGR